MDSGHGQPILPRRNGGSVVITDYLLIAIAVVFIVLSRFNQTDQAGNIVYFGKPWPKLRKRQ